MTRDGSWQAKTNMATASTDTVIVEQGNLFEKSTMDLNSNTTSLTVTPNSLTSPSPKQSADDNLNLTRTSTNPSPYFSLPLWRKSLIVFCLSFTALAATFSSTSLFSVVSEIAEDLNASSSSISIVNAAVLLVMGFSSFIYGPISRLIGRKWTWCAASTVFLICTIGAAASPNIATFTAMRVLSGLQGTHFHVAGQAILADLFEPVQRGTATGFFLAGTVFGPPFGPCVAGIMVTFTTWRAILWLQVTMMGLGLVLSLFFLPELRRPGEIHEHKTVLSVVKEFDCRSIFKPMIYPNVFLTDLTCGLLSWSQYTLLAAPRHLLTPRFHFTSPLISGLFYIAPGCGFLLGTVVGGCWSDLTVRKWIVIRNFRLPQDRLRSGMPAFFFLIPVSSLIYGWGLQYEVGGLALPIVTAFFSAMGLLVAFASVNTYCAEVLPKQRPEVIAGKYLVQYTFGAIGSAAIVPLIDAIGIGWASTVGVVFVLVSGVMTMTTATYGLRMQRRVERGLLTCK